MDGHVENSETQIYWMADTCVGSRTMSLIAEMIFFFMCFEHQTCIAKIMINLLCCVMRFVCV